MPSCAIPTSDAIHKNLIFHQTSLDSIRKIQRPSKKTNLEKLLDIMIGLGRGLHERNPPCGSLGLTLGRRNLPDFGTFVALVGGQHHWYRRQVGALQLLDARPYGPQLLQGLSAAHRVHQDERVALENGENQGENGAKTRKTAREDRSFTLLMESRCIAGNWWDPVVSVIWRVHMFLLQLITWKIEWDVVR